MPSDKTVVIDHLWDVLTAEGRNPRVVYFQDVQDAIRYCNANLGTKLSDRNPANFMKDMLRGRNPSVNWPQRLADLKITARQQVGQNRVFEFVDYANGQTVPFPDLYSPEGLEAVPVQSISLSLASKSLGRSDESWLIQVAVHLKVIETHLATRSPLGVCQVDHLQVGVKLGGSEVDSLFLAVVERDNGERINALITCEAKQARDPILDDQIVKQIVAAYRSVKPLDLHIGLIIPLAIKAISPNGEVLIVEFEAWTPEQAEAREEDLGGLSVAARELYALRPPVPGVGYEPPISRRRPRQPAV